MNYAAIKPCDIANGPGVRVSLFVSGCTHHCPGCFQPETWDFQYGSPFTEDTVAHILDLLAPDYVEGLTLLGGEPMEPANREALLPLLDAVRQRYPKKSIWCYTGYTFEVLRAGKPGPKETIDAMLSHLDVLVDGPFVESKKNLNLRFRGSSNQRLIAIPSSISTGCTILWDDGR
ncbi:anaerobic ribonucleoside-triphosphate reductase activating protein [Candidatus Avoscillospira sp. LCP25S3_F1]|uniref:anaerobic ribonucleoside-triphosphate reductase activating protein n=1 Tax=Candidatus Avoscillospira sp. LCP25S3_F1 TaxID=3438825 RepID=UPI003F90C903